MWSIANEPASNEEGAREYFEPLVTLTRELDPTRPVTFVNVMFATFENDRIADLFDVICLNRYYGWYVDYRRPEDRRAQLEAELRGWQEKFASPLIMTEYGADTVAGYHSIYDVPLTEEYQTQLPRDVPPRASTASRDRRRAGLELRRLPDQERLRTASTATRRASSRATASPRPPPTPSAHAGPPSATPTDPHPHRTQARKPHA